MMVVSVLELSVVIRLSVVKVVKVEGNIDSGRLLAGTVFY